MKLIEQLLNTSKHIIASRRHVFICLASLLIILALILQFGNFKNSRKLKRMTYYRGKIGLMSMAKRASLQTGLMESISEELRKSIQDKERELIMAHMQKHRKYFFNYTECLHRQLINYGETLPGSLAKSLSSFGELMAIFHKLCSNEVLPDGKNCRTKTVGRMHIDRKPLKMSTLKQELADVRIGGHWGPLDCVPKAKVAIVIPFRNREQHLPVLLRHLHPLLQRQNLLYRIFVIEQVDRYPFNRGKLMNVGFKEANKIFDFNCFVFHDTDLIPEDDRNDYGCPSSPRHLSVAIDKFDYNLPYPGLFGGVEMFTKEHYKQVNGFRNSYWGWGAEDDDLYKRIVKVGLQLTRPPITVARYTMIKHSSSEKPPDRMDKLQFAENSLTTDGLMSLRYKVLSSRENLLYTLFKVDLKMEDDMVH